jgi:hypothetical protein
LVLPVADRNHAARLKHYPASMKCPIASAERRLRDAFQHWRQLEQDYFNPDRFRMALNSFLQESRNVTFILQKNKVKVTGFDAWYASWQERMKADPILRWAVESRNRITKQGDLETESQCLVRFSSDWTDELTREFRANPIAPSEAIIAHVLQSVPREVLSEEGLVCIERRWIDTNLPDTEILQATSHILLALSDLIRDAHEQILSKEFPDLQCELSPKLARFRDTYPLELANVDDTRKVWVQATSSEKIKYDITGSAQSRKEIESFAADAHARYGLIEPERGTRPDPLALTSAIALFDEASRKMLEKDGRLYPVIHALDAGSRRVYQISLIMHSRAAKHLAIRRAALLLENCEIAWAVLTGEAWIATVETGQPFRHAVNHPARQEALTLNAVSATGQFMNRYVIFERSDGRIVFGTEQNDESPANIMVPILAAIRRVPRTSVR